MSTIAHDAIAELSVRPLAADQIDRAFPLIRDTAPGITAPLWADYARVVLHGQTEVGIPGGIVVAESPGRYLLGLFTWQIRRRIDMGRLLHVDNVVVPQMFGRDLVCGVLLDHVLVLRRQHLCSAMTVLVAPDAEWQRELLAFRGYRMQACAYALAEADALIYATRSR